MHHPGPHAYRSSLAEDDVKIPTLERSPNANRTMIRLKMKTPKHEVKHNIVTIINEVSDSIIGRG